jgi:hypothetical protein
VKTTLSVQYPYHYWREKCLKAEDLIRRAAELLDPKKETFQYEEWHKQRKQWLQDAGVEK